MQPASQSEPINILPSGGPVFDRNRKYEFTIPHPDGPKSCVVRFPTDEEWCQRTRQQTIINRKLGRDTNQTDLKGEVETARDLFESIREDASEAQIASNKAIGFDEYEALLIINRLSRCEVTSVDQRPNAYAITMTVVGGAVVHHLRVPSQEQAFKFGRGSVHTYGKRNSSETKVALEPSGELWNKLVIRVENYLTGEKFDPGVVPIIHKDVAVNELLAQINNAIDEGPAPEK